MTPNDDSNDAELELDLNHFKEMVRTSTADHEDSLNRSQDFVGSLSSHSGGRSPRPPKSKAGTIHSPDRPDDWLGSPSGSAKRKSYKVKNALPHVKPPGLHDESNHSVKSLPKPSSRPSAATATATATSSPAGRPPSGLTRHTLGASSSHHKSSFATSSLPSGSSHSASELAPDPETYKAMMRASVQQDEDGLNRSQDFLGGNRSSHGNSPRRQTSYKASPSENKPHKWGPPATPEQFRPEGWLGSPSSAKGGKSYKVKSPVANAIPNLDGDGDGDGHSSNSLPQQPSLVVADSMKTSKPRGMPMKSQSLAVGSTAPNLSKVTTTGGSGRPTGRPVKSQSLKMGQRNRRSLSPIRADERVDRKKFVQSFSNFEHSVDPPVPSLFASSWLSSPVPPSPHRSTVIGSPKKGTRNFRVSKEARAKNDLLQKTSGHSLHSSSSHHTPISRRDWNPLNDAIAKLRRMAIREPDSTSSDKCDQQASEIIQVLKHLRHNRVDPDSIEGSETFLSIINTLRREGIMETRMEVDAVKAIEGSILEDLELIVRQLDYHEPHRMELEVCTRLLNQVSGNNSRSSGMIEDVIGRLRQVSPLLRSNLAEKLDQSIEKLVAISWEIGQREVDELANVIRNLDGDDMDASADPKWDELTRVMSALDHFVGGVGGRLGSFVSEREPTISPRSGAPRNFVISNEAKRKDMAALDLSAHSVKTEPDGELREVMSKLRRVIVAPNANGDKSEQQASELMQMIKHLRQTGVQGDAGAKELFDLLEDLKRRGVISSNLGPNRMGQVRKAVSQLEEVRKQCDYSPTSKEEIANIIQQHLRKLTATSAGAADLIQRAIARLRKVVPDLRDKEQAGMDGAIGRLQAVLMSMQEGQEAQLAQAIRELESTQESADETDLASLQRVVDGLGQAQAKEEHEKNMQRAAEQLAKEEEIEEFKEKARIAKARLTPEDADYLVYALLKLKKAKMMKREAAAVAGFIRNMKPVNTKEDEKASEEALAKVTKAFNSKKKSQKVVRVLVGLCRLNLNDPERAELAEIVRGLGKGKGTTYREEILSAIAKLRKVQMTRPEAKEAAGILFNLRKTKSGGFDIDKSREMMNLRKVMRAEKADVVSEVFQELSKLDLSEKKVNEIAGMVAELGVEALDPSEYQLITMEYVDGVPFMILNIPDGEEYANQIGELGICNHVKKRTSYKTREFRFWIDLEPEDEDSDNLLNDVDSDVEEESDGEDGGSEERADMTPRTKERMKVKMKAKSKSMMLPPKTLSPKPPPKSPKKLHHYAEVTETSSPMTEEKEKKIKFTNKHYWRFKKHNQTVVNEKRWRFEEDFNADEVIWSPLSRDQYDRRKTVGASILATMDKFAPLDDMLLDEFEKDADEKK